jgi:VCBS repeat protein
VPSPVPVGDTPASLVLADFNHDRRLDMAVANAESDNVTIHIGNGHGGFAAGSPIPLTDAPWYIALGDVNRDKRLDLVVPHVGSVVGTTFVPSHDVSVLLGDGAGGFAHAACSPIAVSGTPDDMAAADFDRDGHLDLGVDRLGIDSFSVLLGDRRRPGRAG